MCIRDRPVGSVYPFLQRRQAGTPDMAVDAALEEVPHAENFGGCTWRKVVSQPCINQYGVQLRQERISRPEVHLACDMNLAQVVRKAQEIA